MNQKPLITNHFQCNGCREIRVNFHRMINLFSEEELKEKVKGYTFSDETTLEVMKKVYSENNYLMDPHGAVGYLALGRTYGNFRRKRNLRLGNCSPLQIYGWW